MVVRDWLRTMAYASGGTTSSTIADHAAGDDQGVQEVVAEPALETLRT